MERIGLAASKMAKGNLVTYNIFVIAISSLCSLFLFFICGLTVLVALFLISVIFRFLMPGVFNDSWPSIMKISMAALAVAIGVLNVGAIIKNLKFTKRKI